MRKTITLCLAFLVITAMAVADTHAGFVQPTSITASTAGSNPDIVLINAATGGGGTSYVAPNPSSGGGGTSWHTPLNGTTPVTFTFNFASTFDTFQVLHVWDYYFHSPTDWTIQLYSGLGGSGVQLLNYDFTIVPGPSSTSTLHNIDFPDVLGPVLSGILASRNNSTGGGVGLAEFGFTTALPPVPEPSTLALLGIGTVGLAVKARRRLAA